MQLTHWLRNVTRLVTGRDRWQAEREFAYYAADPRVVREHQARQDELQRRMYFGGLRIARALGILDSTLLSGARVLDLGAGECVLAEAIAFGCGAAEVWAVDAVPKQIWAAAAKYPSRPEIRFVIADVCNLPFEDAQFDVVVGNLVLHHIDPLASLFAEVRRVLKPQGLFAAFEPNPMYGPLAHRQSSENESPLRPGKIVGAAREAGFASVESTYFWSRFETSALGPFCPGYRIQASAGTAERPAAEERGPLALRRPLRPMTLPGLQIDSGCQFAELALRQEKEILALLDHA